VGHSDALDYAALDAFLDEEGTGDARFSGQERGTIHSFVDKMEYADVDDDDDDYADRFADEDDDEEMEIEVKPKNAKPKSSQSQSSRPAFDAATGRRQPQSNPVGPVGTNARLGPTYPAYKGTPVADARKPMRERAIGKTCWV
jgi:hypothetical protein